MTPIMESGLAGTLRRVAGGVLMGLANLVPGISGGTMLLATGVYRPFVDSIADLSAFRWKVRTFYTLGVIGISALLAIVLLAGPVKHLVATHRWIMYSLFIGLTLGGVPLVWRLARPVTPPFWVGAAAGFGLMAWMAFSDLDFGGGESNVLLVAAGVAGASAMILPGVSGAYMLLILGQYERILGAIETAKHGDFRGASGVVIPVAIGVVLGVVVISNLVKIMLDKFSAPTLGFLLGLLLGSVLGIYPFQAAVKTGEPREYWTPEIGQVGAAIGLVVVGLAITLAIDRLGGKKNDDASVAA